MTSETGTSPSRRRAHGPRVVVWCLAGRKPNMELQIPLMQRVLRQHPNVEYHLVNLARSRDDFFWIKCALHEGVSIQNQFYRVRPHWVGYKRAWEFFAQPEYEDAVIIKMDDDIVFFDTDRFGDFVDAIQNNPGTIVSANIINNGACSRIQPGLREEFDAAGFPLLDWHKHNQTARMAHKHFFEHWRTILAEPAEVVPTDDWLSINMIGYDHATGCELADKIGFPPDGTTNGTYKIAGREFLRDDRVGDEGVANKLPRAIARGFIAAHLSFNPQNVRFADLVAWREQYAQIGKTYLRRMTVA